MNYQKLLDETSQISPVFNPTICIGRSYNSLEKFFLESCCQHSSSCPLLDPERRSEWSHRIHFITCVQHYDVKQAVPKIMPPHWREVYERAKAAYAQAQDTGGTI